GSGRLAGMNYRQAVDYILSFANWEQAPAQAYAARKFDLRRMRSFLGRLGEPQRGRRTVHIAGSKGKGSTAAMVASVLRAAGYTTGLYTSPHLHSFRERIAVDGEAIAEADFARLTAALMPQVAAENERGCYGRLTTFELLTALAFLYFGQRGAQWQVLEVGLGGRLDATNVVDEKDVCVIGPIGLEHTAILGDKPAQIAAEKAAIVRPGSAVVMGVQPYPEAATVVRDVAEKMGAYLVDVGTAYAWQRLDWDADGQAFRLWGPEGARELWIPLLGGHQLENAAAAVAAINGLRARGVAIAEEALAYGLAATRWPGRLEVVRREPWVVLDGAHTPVAAERIRQALGEYFAFRRCVLVVGASQDKDLAAMVAALRPLALRHAQGRPLRLRSRLGESPSETGRAQGRLWRVVATRSRHPRAAPPPRVAEAFAADGIMVEVAEAVAEAVEAALAWVEAPDLVCVLGSLFAAEAREHLLRLPATV
ncbi:MAG: bifunctional folylpolyglutamate synthase/dihydrofolate synthase, partial [Dehalococcoidia bacterium]